MKVFQATGRQRHYSHIGMIVPNQYPLPRFSYTNQPGGNVEGMLSHLGVAAVRSEAPHRRMRMEVRLGISECVEWGKAHENLKDNIYVECSAPTAIYLMELHGLFPPCDLLALEAAIEAENWEDVYEVAQAGRPDIVKLTPVNIHSHSQGNN